MNERDLGQLLFQSEQQPLDFVKKYGKLTIPLVLVGVAILLAVPRLMDWIVGTLGLDELIGAMDDIPNFVFWVFLGVSVLYLVFCIVRISKFQGFQVSVYQKGAMLNLISKTEMIHFDEFGWAEFKDPDAFIIINDRGLPIRISVEDVPEAALFVEELSIAFEDYILDKIQENGINNVSFAFGTGMKLENGNIIDTAISSKKMSLESIKVVSIDRKSYKLSGILDNGKETDFFWEFKYLFNIELFSRVISEHTAAQSYADYMMDKIRTDGVDKISITLGQGMKLENGNLVDSVLITGTKKMPLANVKSVEIERSWYKISGILENGEESEILWEYKYLQHGDIFVQVISEFTPVEEITSPPPQVLDFNEEFMNAEKMQKFEQKHKLSEEKEGYLAFSAILALSNHDSPRVFKMQWLPKIVVKKGLKNMWDVTDRQTTLDTLADLSTANLSAPRANEFLTTMKETGIIPKIYQEAKENLIKLGFTEDELNNITNLNAWDYGRAGFIARNAVFSGFLKEDETWEYLKQVATNAGKEYSNWREYLSAYVLGRAAAYNNSSHDISAILEYLLKDESNDRLFVSKNNGGENIHE
ncbi:MAG: DUF1266 domain-containing protein [Defluviitaleaceae bacterium]|nr:DUF1266 domain-containing protein [Defluviitaleaceae bacterium]